MQTWGLEATLIRVTCDEHIRSNRIQNTLANMCHEVKTNTQKKLNIEEEFWRTDNFQFDCIFHLQEFEGESS